MAVRLRFTRLGRRHKPFFRLGAIDARSPRNGRVIEELGYYDPAARDESRQYKLNKERIEYWLSVGAQPSDTARNLFHKIGIAIEPAKRPTKPSRAEREAAEAAAKPPEPETSTETEGEGEGEKTES